MDGCNIRINAVSQIVVSRSPPNHSNSRMKIYYAYINIHLYKLAQLTGQLKENIVFWITQKKAFNPADLLGKFDIDKDHGISTKSAAATMVTAEPRYLLQENVG